MIDDTDTRQLDGIATRLAALAERSDEQMILVIKNMGLIQDQLNRLENKIDASLGRVDGPRSPGGLGCLSDLRLQARVGPGQVPGSSLSAFGDHSPVDCKVAYQNFYRMQSDVPCVERGKGAAV